eukprot:PLAT7670.1.p1 GENE.PLAT7670.1~~PLAT7670.1.p1  ORF type:complete len:1593 (-),score=715.96 PLAT7670.1:103-4623(-)
MLKRWRLPAVWDFCMRQWRQLLREHSVEAAARRRRRSLTEKESAAEAAARGEGFSFVAFSDGVGAARASDGFVNMCEGLFLNLLRDCKLLCNRASLAALRQVFASHTDGSLWRNEAARLFRSESADVPTVDAIGARSIITSSTLPQLVFPGDMLELQLAVLPTKIAGRFTFEELTEFWMREYRKQRAESNLHGLSLVGLRSALQAVGLFLYKPGDKCGCLGCSRLTSRKQKVTLTERHRRFALRMVLQEHIAVQLEFISRTSHSQMGMMTLAGRALLDGMLLNMFSQYEKAVRSVFAHYVVHDDPFVDVAGLRWEDVEDAGLTVQFVSFMRFVNEYHLYPLISTDMASSQFVDIFLGAAQGNRGQLYHACNTDADGDICSFCGQPSFRLDEHGREALVEVFRTQDTDGSGEIDAAEIQHMMQSLGYHATPVQQRMVLGWLDSDGSGKVSCSEFVSGMERWEQLQRREQLGSLTLPEFQLCIALLAIEAFGEMEDGYRACVFRLLGIMERTFKRMFNYNMLQRSEFVDKEVRAADSVLHRQLRSIFTDHNYHSNPLCVDRMQLETFLIMARGCRLFHSLDADSMTHIFSQYATAGQLDLDAFCFAFDALLRAEYETRMLARVGRVPRWDAPLDRASKMTPEVACKRNAAKKLRELHALYRPTGKLALSSLERGSSALGGGTPAGRPGTAGQISSAHLPRTGRRASRMVSLAMPMKQFHRLRRIIVDTGLSKRAAAGSPLAAAPPPTTLPKSDGGRRPSALAGRRLSDPGSRAASPSTPMAPSPPTVPRSALRPTPIFITQTGTAGGASGSGGGGRSSSSKGIAVGGAGLPAGSGSGSGSGRRQMETAPAGSGLLRATPPDPRARTAPALPRLRLRNTRQSWKLGRPVLVTTRERQRAERATHDICHSILRSASARAAARPAAALPSLARVREAMMEASGPKHEQQFRRLVHEAATAKVAGDLHGAKEHLQRALALAPRMNNAQLHVNVLCQLALVCRGLRQFEAAIDAFEQVQTLITPTMASDLPHIILGHLGSLHLALGQFTRAIARHEARLDMARRAGDKASEGRASAGLGAVYQAMGKFSRAEECHQRHLKLARDLRMKEEESVAWGNLGTALLSQGAFSRALVAFQENHCRQAAGSAGEARALGSLGHVYHCMRQYEQACDYHEQHLALAKKLGDLPSQSRALAGIANARVAIWVRDAPEGKEDLTAAMELLMQAEALLDGDADRVALGRLHGSMGIIRAHQGNHKEALRLHNADMDIAKEVGDRLGVCNAHGNLGNVYAALKRYKAAEKHFRYQLTIAESIGNSSSVASALYNLGCTCMDSGREEEARKLFRRQLTLSRELKDQRSQAIAIVALGRIWFTRGAPPDGTVVPSEEQMKLLQKALSLFSKYEAMPADVRSRDTDLISAQCSGRAALFMGTYLVALPLLERALELQEGHTEAMMASHEFVGMALKALNRYEAALHHFKQQRVLARQLHNMRAAERAGVHLGSTYERWHGELTEAS